MDSGLFAQHVACTAQSVDQPLRMAAIDGTAQPAHVHVDQVRLGVEMQIPDLLEHHRARDHLTGMLQQQLQQLEFFGSQFEFAIGTVGTPGETIEFEIRDAQS